MLLTLFKIGQPASKGTINSYQFTLSPTTCHSTRIPSSLRGNCTINSYKESTRTKLSQIMPVFLPTYMINNYKWPYITSNYFLYIHKFDKIKTWCYYNTVIDIEGFALFLLFLLTRCQNGFLGVYQLCGLSDQLTKIDAQIRINKGKF